jgi:hypothetical protein
LFWFPVFVLCIWFSRPLCGVFLFPSLCGVHLFQVEGVVSKIQSMSTLVSSSLQIRRHEYSRHFIIVILVSICNLLFYAINIDTVSLFADFFFSEYELYLFEWMNIVLLCQKKNHYIGSEPWIGLGYRFTVFLHICLS